MKMQKKKQKCDVIDEDAKEEQKHDIIDEDAKRRTEA